MAHTAPPSNLRDENCQEESGRGSSLWKSDRGGGHAADGGGDRETCRSGWRRLLRRGGDRKHFPTCLILLLAVILVLAFALAVAMALAFGCCLPAQA